jgi:hypothetical protein
LILSADVDLVKTICVERYAQKRKLGKQTLSVLGMGSWAKKGCEHLGYGIMLKKAIME